MQSCRIVAILLGCELHFQTYHNGCSSIFRKDLVNPFICLASIVSDYWQWLLFLWFFSEKLTEYILRGRIDSYAGILYQVQTLVALNETWKRKSGYIELIPIWTEYDQIGLKWTELDQIGPTWTEFSTDFIYLFIIIIIENTCVQFIIEYLFLFLRTLINKTLRACLVRDFW